jgi:hypothetical protein
MAQNPSIAAKALGEALGAPVRLWHAFRVEDGSAVVRLIAPADAGPEPAPKQELAAEPVPPAEATAPADPPADGDSVTTATNPTDRRMTAKRLGRLTPGWRQVVGEIDDAELDSDTGVHELLLSQMAGDHDRAEAFIERLEDLTAPGVQIPPAALTVFRDYVEMVTELAEKAASASRHLQQYYAGVSEEVAGGVELPKDGKFITGEGSG